MKNVFTRLFTAEQIREHDKSWRQYQYQLAKMRAARALADHQKKKAEAARAKR